jgi:hypothetical protein
MYVIIYPSNLEAVSSIINNRLQVSKLKQTVDETLSRFDVLNKRLERQLKGQAA